MTDENSNKDISLSESELDDSVLDDVNGGIYLSCGGNDPETQTIHCAKCGTDYVIKKAWTQYTCPGCGVTRRRNNVSTGRSRRN